MACSRCRSLWTTIRSRGSRSTEPPPFLTYFRIRFEKVDGERERARLPLRSYVATAYFSLVAIRPRPCPAGHIQSQWIRQHQESSPYNQTIRGKRL